MNYGMFLLKVPIARVTLSHVAMRKALKRQELIAVVSFSSGTRMFVPYQRRKLLES
jgi:hypothetical protein